MTLDSRRLIGGGLAVLGALVGVWLIFAAADRVYLAPRGERLAEISDLRERVGRYEKGLAEAPRIDEAIAAFADRTLGPDRETVDHRLRTRLNRIAEEVGIRSPVVSTGATSAQPSPARREFRGSKLRPLRDEIDFVELDGSISGQGTLAQVVGLVDRIDAEPWLKRIEQIRLDPKSNGEQVVVTVRLTTLYLPGRSPEHEVSTEWSAARLARFDPFLSANPFRVPPPPPPPKPAVAETKKERAAPPPPPPFPWANWVLTGVAEGPDGHEAWLRNRSSNETRRLSFGQDLNRAVLAGITDDWAEFSLEGRRFRVRVGQSLNDRTPIND